MKWKLPPKIKIHEALGCIADGRIEMNGDEAKIFSSSKGKFYTVTYDGENALMCNDNGSYWVGYLGYPALAFLMLKGKVTYDSTYAGAFKNIQWKDINTRFKNDFVKTEKYVLEIAHKRGFNVEKLKAEIERIYSAVTKLHFDLLGEKIKPPEGY